MSNDNKNDSENEQLREDAGKFVRDRYLRPKEFKLDIKLETHLEQIWGDHKVSMDILAK